MPQTPHNKVSEGDYTAHSIATSPGSRFVQRIKMQSELRSQPDLLKRSSKLKLFLEDVSEAWTRWAAL